MEGPSLLIAAEQLISFNVKKVNVVSGNTKIGKERLLGKEVLDVFSWGKHLVLQFDDFALRVHFMLFGTYEAVIEGVSVTGDYKRTKEPRLQLEFSHQFYAWRKEFALLKHLRIHRKGACPHCSGKIIREKTGTRQRWSYYCLLCQPEPA